MDFIIRYDNDF